MHNFEFLKKILVLLSGFIVFFIIYRVVDNNSEKNLPVDQKIFFRFNQLGYLPDTSFEVIAFIPKSRSFSQTILLDNNKNQILSLKLESKESMKAWSLYRIKIPALKIGTYFLRIGDLDSTPIDIIKYDLSFLLDASLSFFARQRCGSITVDHDIECHQKRVVLKDQSENSSIHMSGGWHDAGDYIRYVLTTSFSTVMLSNAAQLLENRKVSQERLLNEMDWGLKWLDKMWANKKNFYYQIGDISDHDQWRLPEKDDESARVQKIYRSDLGKGANLAGRMVASMALYAQLLKKDPKRVAEVKYWEARAIEIYNWSQDLLSSQSSTNDFYVEKVWQDDMALGALELFHLTGTKSYLDSALAHLKNIENPYTFDYANIHMLVYYKLGLYSDRHKQLALSEMKKMLTLYEHKSKTQLYGIALESFFWGSHMHIQGTAVTAFFYDRLLQKNIFSSLAFQQWDYLMGKNQWGVNFVSGVGRQSMNHPHHQIAQITQVELLGYWSPGPVPQQVWASANMQLKNHDTLKSFNTTTAVLHNDSGDYITNEPALTTTATGLLLTAAVQQFVDSNSLLIKSQ